MNEEISAELKRSADTISRIDPAQIRKAADILIEAFRNGGQAIFMGNGGSSADAQHIAAEFSGRYMLERPALPGVCLSNIAPVTAIGNDYSYDLVFKRQIEGICRKGDVVIGMSTSGNSKNVILAMEAAKERVRCPLLGLDNTCLLYEHRPITCRIYGVPTSIHGKAHVCGECRFKKGQPYPTVALDRIQDRLADMSRRIGAAVGSRFRELHRVYVPVSMALITKYDDAYLGIGPAPKE